MVLLLFILFYFVSEYVSLDIFQTWIQELRFAVGLFVCLCVRERERETLELSVKLSIEPEIPAEQTERVAKTEKTHCS